MTDVIIGDTYFIRVDGRGHTLYKRLGTNKKGEEMLKAEGYYRTIDQALKHLARLKVLNKHKKLQINEYLRELKDVQLELVKAVQGNG